VSDVHVTTSVTVSLLVLPSLGLVALALVIAGVVLALSRVQAVWAAFCIVLGIAIVLLGIGERTARDIGFCFLGAALALLVLRVAGRLHLNSPN
jgi:hypothetical protein